MKLDEIEALAPNVIAKLSPERLNALRAEVQIVDWPHEPTEAERAHILSRVRATFHNLESEHLTRSMRLCGGLPDPYLMIRLPDASGAE